MTFIISYLWSHPQIHGGAQMVRGSRVTLEAIHERVKSGESIEKVCEKMKLNLEHTKKAYKEWLETRRAEELSEIKRTVPYIHIDPRYFEEDEG